MASKEVAQSEDGALRERQIAALERLHELGAAPRKEGERYDGNPQVKALQLVYEGRFGGPGLKQGRPRSRGEPRAAEVIAEEIRTRYTKRMSRAIERALRADAGVRANLDAVKLALQIENNEAQLQLRESQADFDTATKEELLVTLFELIGQPQTTAAIEGTAFDIAEAEVVNTGEWPQEEQGHPPAAGAAGSNGDSVSTAEDGRNGRSSRSNDRGRSKRNRPKGSNPEQTASLRRTVERRRASRMGKN